MRTVLILGAGVMQRPAIRAARRLGLYVVVADGNRGAFAREEADEFLHVDLKDLHGMVEAATAVRARRGLDAVFTAGTDFSSTVAWVAERLGLPGTGYEAALNATDKFRMRGVLREAGVTVPDFAVLTRAELERSGCESVRSLVALPVVVKPADSMGARGVVRADDWDEAEAFAREAVEFSRSGSVVVEGYIDGPEFSLDAIVYGEDIQIAGFADRHIRFPPYFIEMGHTIPTAIPRADQAAVVAEFRRAIRALGLGPGAAKGDIKLSSHGVVVGEVAARLSGGYMSGWTYPLSSGVPLSEIALRVALGEAPPRARPLWRKTTAERAVISIPGILREIRGIEEARLVAGVEEVFLARSTGERLTFPRNNVEKVGNVIATAPDREEAVTAAETAVETVVPLLEAGNDETDRFLFGACGAADAVPPEYRQWAFAELACDEGDMLGGWRREVAARARAGSGGRDAAQRIDVGIPRTLEESRSRDWSYRTIRATLRRLEADGRVRLRSCGEGGGSTAGRLLVRALCKGGLQGVLYVLDSLAPGPREDRGSRGEDGPVEPDPPVGYTPDS